MGERKVQQFHYPIDFDPTLLAKRKRVTKAPVNGMLPFSLQCNTCGAFTKRGKKFNGRKEDSLERYLGIKIWRIYMKCPNCKAEITFKTDPQNANYTLEHGATRNFEATRVRNLTLAALRSQRSEEESTDAMVSLENRAIDSKRELEELEALTNMLERGTAAATADAGAVSEARRAEALAAAAAEARKAEEEDEAEARRIFSGGDGSGWDANALDTLLEIDDDGTGFGDDFSDDDGEHDTGDAGRHGHVQLPDPAHASDPSTLVPAPAPPPRADVAVPEGPARPLEAARVSLSDSISSGALAPAPASTAASRPSWAGVVGSTSQNADAAAGNDSGSQVVASVRRIVAVKRAAPAPTLTASTASTAATAATGSPAPTPASAASSAGTAATAPDASAAPGTGGISLLSGYGSDSDSD